MKPAVLLVALALPSLAFAGDELPMKSTTGAAPASPAAAAPATPAVAAAAAAQTPSALPDGRALLRGHVQACGGADALSDVQNCVIRSTYAIPAQNLSGSMTVAIVRPNKIRSSIDLAGIGRMDQGFDGTTGWETSALTGARLLGAGELEQLQSPELNVFNLASLDSLYSKAETVGLTEFAGSPAWEVRLVGGGGRESTAYFHAGSGLMTGLKTVVTTQLGEMPGTITLSDYKSYGRLKLPSKSSQSVLGGVIEAVMTLDAVELNAPAAQLPSFDLPPEIQALIDAENDPAAVTGEDPEAGG